MRFNKAIEYIISRSVISNNSSELLYNTIVLKDREKDLLLVFATVARHLLKGKEGLLLLLVICSEVCHNSQEEYLIRRGPDIIRDVNS
jgi:hypothetical protein